MRKAVLTLLAVAAVGSGGVLDAAPASAGTLDQSQPNAIPGFEPVGGTHGAAQTFTAGLSGPLDQVDISIAGMDCTPDLLVEIRTVDSGGTPTGTILAVAAVSRASIPDNVGATPPGAMTSVSFSAPAVVTAGIQYAIVLPGVSPDTCYAFYVADGNPYSGGATFTSETDSFSSLAASGLDYAFRTYVLQQSATTPAPTSNPTSTGQRAAALTRCKTKAKKKHWPKKKLKKCKKKAKKLPA